MKTKSEVKSEAKAAPEPLIAGSLVHVPLNRLLTYQPAKADGAPIGNRPIDKAWVGELADSIEANGLDAPLLVWNGAGSDKDDGVLTELSSGKEIPGSFLVAGFHRRAALSKVQARNPVRYTDLFPSGIPCVVRGGTLQGCIAAQLRENLLRKNPDDSDVLTQLLRLRDEFGMRAKEIAKAISKSPSFVAQVFAIEETLGTETVEDVKKGKIGLQAAKTAAQDTRRAEKKGIAVDKKAVVTKLKEKKATLAAAGRERDERRVSASALANRYEAIPASAKFSPGRRVLILEAALLYLAKRDGSELPDELSVASAPAAKKGADESED